MPKPKCIIYDVDDVLLNFSHVLMKLRRRLYGVNENIYLLEQWKLSKEQQDTFRAYEGWIYARMQPKRGVLETLQNVRKHGYSIVLMTARSEKFKTETIASLKYFGIVYDELLFNKNKALKINKLQERYDIVAFVDDKPSTVEKVVLNTTVKNVYLLDMPCNYGVRIKGVKRIGSISEMKESEGEE